MTDLIGALMDPFLLVPAAVAGWFISRWWGRAAFAAILGITISILIVLSLDAARVILPSDKPELLLTGSITRGLVAWAVAEAIAWARRIRATRAKQS